MPTDMTVDDIFTPLSGYFGFFLYPFFFAQNRAQHNILCESITDQNLHVVSAFPVVKIVKKCLQLADLIFTPIVVKDVFLKKHLVQCFPHF